MKPIEGTTIEWAENPLATRILLTEAGKREFVLRHILVWLLEDLDAAANWTGLDIEELAERTHAFEFLTELEKVHCGDCTCVPASCTKCHAEETAGIETTAGLGRHEGHAIAGFTTGTIEETIEKLRAPPVATEDWQKPHVERWSDERSRAIAWLTKYKTERLGR